jgi:hypothetical protein
MIIMAIKTEKDFKILKTRIKLYINHKMPLKLGFTLKLTYTGTHCAILTNLIMKEL